MKIPVPKIAENIADKIREYDQTLNPYRVKNFYFTKPRASDNLNFSPTGLLALNDCADISRPFSVTSHRKLTGKIIVFGKQSLMKLARPLIQLFFRRQIIFNSHVVAMANAVVAMESRINYLESRLSQQTSYEEKNTSR